ncbi:MAG: DUF4290 domain-containing protein [Prevotella sp.]|nr:DUF4290 domain-containing protein [Prevotella sp.]
MDIKGLDYNTQRQPLLMPEYGREIQKMVEHAITLPTREERLRCAHTIVKLMESKNQQLHESTNYEQTLWDHLYLMSRKQLDIDWPYDVSQAEKIAGKPEPMAHPQTGEQPRLRHYGRLMEGIFDKLKEMPEGDERNELVRIAANQMKRDLVTWGHGSIDDEKVADDLARFTDGKIQIDLSTFRFERITNTEGNDNRRSKRRRNS